MGAKKATKKTSGGEGRRVKAEEADRAGHVATEMTLRRAPTIFVSWSGDTSRKVAEALAGWLQQVIPPVQTFVSSSDIDRGAVWFGEILDQLEAAAYGILCVTPGNLTSEWLHFEAGAMGTKFRKGRVTPLLLGLKKTDLRPPLSLYQATTLRQDELADLVYTLNEKLSLSERERATLDKAVETWWPQLDQQLRGLDEAARKEAEKRATKAGPLERDEIEKRLDAILAEVQSLAGQRSDSAALPGQQSASVPGPVHRAREILVRALEDTFPDLPAGLDQRMAAAATIGLRLKTYEHICRACGAQPEPALLSLSAQALRALHSVPSPPATK